MADEPIANSEHTLTTVKTADDLSPAARAAFEAIPQTSDEAPKVTAAAAPAPETPAAASPAAPPEGTPPPAEGTAIAPEPDPDADAARQFLSGYAQAQDKRQENTARKGLEQQQQRMDAVAARFKGGDKMGAVQEVIGMIGGGPADMSDIYTALTNQMLGVDSIDTVGQPISQQPAYQDPRIAELEQTVAELKQDKTTTRQHEEAAQLSHAITNAKDYPFLATKPASGQIVIDAADAHYKDTGERLSHGQVAEILNNHFQSEAEALRPLLFPGQAAEQQPISQEPSISPGSALSNAQSSQSGSPPEKVDFDPSDPEAWTRRTLGI